MRKEILLCTVLLIIFACGGSNKQKKMRKEPYIDIVTKTIKLTYEVEEGGLYWQRHSGYIIDDSRPSIEISCMVSNTSEHGGTFVLYAYMSSQGSKIKFKVNKYIGAGETVSISQNKMINDYTFQTDVKVDKWGIIAPEKEIQKEVIKYKIVYD